MRVIELFAGVGGFRLGLERASEEFVTVFANQWEPNKKKQWAYENYISHWDNCVCEDITKIDKESLPDFDLLVGGFPCQPFSKARSADKALGLEDEQKGILWWQIREILEKKNPKYVLLENVDRLLKSPTKQRGRDFGVILKGFFDLGYTVEWRVINAADYGNAQRRRRTYILAYKGSYKNCLNECFPLDEIDNQIKETRTYVLNKTETEVFNNFKADFGSVGYCENGIVKTKDVLPKFEKSINLAEILISSDRKFYLTDKQIEKFKYLKGSKKIPRVTKDGHEWIYSEGAMAFPDDLDKPSRTMLTSEGSVNRCSHVVEDNGLRFLSPIECERLNGFPDDWTKGMPDRMRYFCMGNALVVPIVERIGKKIGEIECKEKQSSESI